MPLCEGLPCRRAVVRDQFAGIGESGQHLRDRPGIAGPDQRALQAQAERRVRQVMTHRENVEPEALVPEAAGHRHQLERIPPVRVAFGDDARIVGQPGLQVGHDRRGHVQLHLAAALRIEVDLVEEPLEPGDVVHVHVGDEQRHRRVRRNAAMNAVSASCPQSIISSGWPSRSITADADPNSTACEPPTPRKRSAQLMPRAPRSCAARNWLIPASIASRGMFLHSLSSDRCNRSSTRPHQSPGTLRSGPCPSRSGRPRAWASNRMLLRIEVGMMRALRDGSGRLRFPRRSTAPAALAPRPARRTNARRRCAPPGSPRDSARPRRR